LGIVKSQPASPIGNAAIAVIESEMVVRSFKCLMRRAHISSLSVFLQKLNVILGFAPDGEGFLEVVRTKSVEKFGEPVSFGGEGRTMLIVRAVCLCFGITIASRVFNRPLTAEDVVSVDPVISFPFTGAPELDAKTELATTIHAAGDAKCALELFSLAINSGEESGLHFHKAVSLSYFYLGLILNAQGHHEEALIAGLRSMLTQERHCDQLHPEVIVRYAALSEFAKSAGKTILGFAFSARAAHLAELLCPIHPWVITAFLSAGENALAFDAKAALLYFNLALERANRIAPGGEQTARIYHNIAMTHIQQRELEQARQFAELAAKASTAEQYRYALDLLKSDLSGKPK
jgi:tetratricopeptide (TPR) repeat protein